MKIINNKIINFTFEDAGELNVYTVNIYVNMIPYKAIYSPIVGFIHCSLEDDVILLYVSKEINKILKK